MVTQRPLIDVFSCARCEQELPIQHLHGAALPWSQIQSVLTLSIWMSSDHKGRSLTSPDIPDPNFRHMTTKSDVALQGASAYLGVAAAELLADLSGALLADIAHPAKHSLIHGEPYICDRPKPGPYQRVALPARQA